MSGTKRRNRLYWIHSIKILSKTLFFSVRATRPACKEHSMSFNSPGARSVAGLQWLFHCAHNEAACRARRLDQSLPLLRRIRQPVPLGSIKYANPEIRHAPGGRTLKSLIERIPKKINLFGIPLSKNLDGFLIKKCPVVDSTSLDFVRKRNTGRIADFRARLFEI